MKPLCGVKGRETAPPTPVVSPLMMMLVPAQVPLPVVEVVPTIGGLGAKV